MSGEGLFGLIKPRHPEIIRLRSRVNGSALPDLRELGAIFQYFKRSSDGPRHLDDVLSAKHGNCIGLSAAAVSVLTGHPSMATGQAFVIILDRGTARFHAVTAYRARLNQPWSVLDLTHTLRDGLCADVFAADPPPWRDLGEPARKPPTRTLMGFNDREIVTPDWGFKRSL